MRKLAKQLCRSAFASVFVCCALVLVSRIENSGFAFAVVRDESTNITSTTTASNSRSTTRNLQQQRGGGGGGGGNVIQKNPQRARDRQRYRGGDNRPSLPPPTSGGNVVNAVDWWEDESDYEDLDFEEEAASGNGYEDLDLFGRDENGDGNDRGNNRGNGNGRGNGRGNGHGRGNGRGNGNGWQGGHGQSASLGDDDDDDFSFGWGGRDNNNRGKGMQWHGGDSERRGGGDNEITIELYVALHPYQPSRKHVVSVFINKYLNFTNSDFSVYGRGTPLPQPNTTFDGRRHLARPFESRNRTWDMYHLFTNPLLVKQGRNKWWWMYDIVYACYWWPSNNPITDEAILDNITTSIKQSLQSDVDDKSLEVWLRRRFADADKPAPMLHFTTDFYELDDEETAVAEWHEPPPGAGEQRPPYYPMHPSHPVGEGQRPQPSTYDEAQPAPPPPLPNTDHPMQTMAPTLYPDGVSIGIAPIDPHGWYWQRYVGLGVFLGTFLCMFCLINVSAYRQRKLKEKELWGCIATEQGVDELLKTGWKIDGSRMEVFDKTKFGYDDDDSMFVGGFEQTEMVKDIPPLPESETTPDTYHR